MLDSNRETDTYITYCPSKKSTENIPRKYFVDKNYAYFFCIYIPSD